MVVDGEDCGVVGVANRSVRGVAGLAAFAGLAALAALATGLCGPGTEALDVEEAR